MKFNERERCTRCQKWVNIYKDWFLSPDGSDEAVCGKCSDKIEKELLQKGLKPDYK